MHNLAHTGCYCFYKLNQNFPSSVEKQMSVYTRSLYGLLKTTTPIFYIKHCTGWSSFEGILSYILLLLPNNKGMYLIKKKEEMKLYFNYAGLKNITIYLHFFPISLLPPRKDLRQLIKMSQIKDKNKSRKWKVGT